VRDGERRLVGDDATEVVIASGPDAFDALDAMARGGFWVGFVAYDLGRTIEQVTPSAADDLGLPDLAFARFDHVRETSMLPPPPVEATVSLGPGRSSLSRVEHAAGVDAIHALLRDGECYQVNLTRRLEFDASPDPRALFSALTRPRTPRCAPSVTRSRASPSHRHHPSCSCGSTAAQCKPARSKEPPPGDGRLHRVPRIMPRT
jgi:anthranilate/para-aminobenzoate synthase component I